MYDYYALLQVPATAHVETIAAAYRRVALCYHPDRRPDNAAATEIFERATEAFEVLSNAQRRRLYDRARLAHPAADYSLTADLRNHALKRGDDSHHRSPSDLSRLGAAMKTDWPTQGQRHRHTPMVHWGPHCSLPAW